MVLALEVVAARAGNELALHTGVRHLRRLAAGADERFFERGVVEVEAGAAGPFRGVDAFDQHAHLAGHAIGRVARLRAGAVATDVDAAHLHRGRHREQRPHVAPVRDRLQLLHLEVLLHARRAGVDHGGRPADRHRLLQRGECELDVDLRREAQPNRNAITLEGIETGQLVAHRIGAGRHSRKAIVARLRRHRRLGRNQCGAGRGHRHAGKHGSLRIADAALNCAGAAGAAALGKRR